MNERAEQGGYVIRGGAEGKARLRVLARVMQPSTTSLLERIGVREGMVCLDMGAGGGGVTFLLARMVGPSGRILGVDIDEAQMELTRAEAAELGLTNVELRTPQAGPTGDFGCYDVAYARFLLTHLPDPAAMLNVMLKALRPGGVIAVEDIDFRGHFCHPERPSFSRFVELYTRVVQKRGADPHIGPKLPGLLLDAGCRDVDMSVVQPAGLTGEVKLLSALTMENIADAVLAENLASREEIDDLVRDLYAFAADPRSVISLPRVVQAWGRRPDTPA